MASLDKVKNNLNNYHPYNVILKYINYMDEDFIIKNMDYFGKEDYLINIIILMKIHISIKFIINICGDNSYKYGRLRSYLEIRRNHCLIHNHLKSYLEIRENMIKILDNIYGYIKDLNYDSKKLLIGS